MESHPWETVLHEFLQCESFPWDAVLHEQLQCGFFPQGAVVQQQAAPAWIPHGVTAPASKPASAWNFLFMGPQVLSGTCSSMGFLWGHSLLWAYPPAWHRVLHRLQVNICSTVDLHGLQ